MDLLHTVGTLVVQSMDAIEWVFVGVANLTMLAIWVSRPEKGSLCHP